MNDIISLSERDHLLLRPDTLCGSTTPVDHLCPVFDIVNPSAADLHAQVTVNWQTLHFAPAVKNLYQEILTNALDRQFRDDSVRHIDVWIDCADAGGASYIRVKNDGMGVPVVIDDEAQAWKPTIAFSHFRSGSNFVDTAGPRFTAGRNGYGCKATNVFSRVFTVKTADPVTHNLFEQRFADNMATVDVPRISKYKLKKGYTDISFLLDFPRLCGTDTMPDHVKQMVMSATVQAAACLQKKVTLAINGVTLGVRHLRNFGAVFSATADGGAYDCVKQDNVTVFELCAVPRQGPVSGVGFVNSLECSDGTHMSFAWSRITAALEQHVKSKYKKPADFTLSPAAVKTNVFLVVKVMVDAPAFSSQTKDKLTTSHTRFLFHDWTPTNTFMKALVDSGVVERVYQDVLDKELVQTRRLMSGTNSSTTKSTAGRRHVVADKYDAATALRSTPGSQRSHCSLLVTEGDSARALAVAGLAVVGREHFGIYALKGKPLNVRTASVEAISKNKEVSTLLQILGLTYGKVYTSLNELNYRKLVIFSDQDFDGAHIGGLILNIIHVLFPSVLQLDPAFVQRFPTPLVRCTHKRSSEVLCFYAKPEYDAWAAGAGARVGEYSIRYFKGLGTSTSALAREYFSSYADQLVDIVWTQASDDVMVKMFGGEHAAARKELLSTQFSKDVFVDYSQASITYEDFVYKEVLPYSNYSNVRNICSMVDGLKPVQRKALFTMLSKNIVNDVKVAQVAALIASHTMYHHGEQSLVETVVGMAQDHVGVSNINLFKPEGQFGTRLDSPSEHSAARYIFTALDPITRYLFRAEDDAVLTYQDEEGTSIEPVFYVPVIPTVLVNGAFGIGTGWSTNVPCYNPMQLMDICEALCDQQERGVTTGVESMCLPATLLPWYDGFQGDIVYKAESNSYTTQGRCVLDTTQQTIRITELPIGVWTHPFVEGVEKKMMVERKKTPSPPPLKKARKGLLTQELVVSIDKTWTDSQVDMLLHCQPAQLEALAAAPHETVLAELGLESELRLSNMHLYSSTGQLVKYDTVERILTEFVQLRLHYYELRKAHMLQVVQQQLAVARQKCAFVEAWLRNELPLAGKTDEQVAEVLTARGFVRIDGSFDYLLNMPFKSLTAARVEKLRTHVQELQAQVAALEAATKHSLWRQDLAELRDAYTSFRQRKQARYASVVKPAKQQSKGMKRARGKK